MAKIPEWMIVVGLIGGGLVVTAAGFVSGMMDGKKIQETAITAPAAGGTRRTRRRHRVHRAGSRKSRA